MKAKVWMLGVALGLWSCAGPVREARAPSASVPHLKVMTYNVNYGLAGDPDTMAAIGECDCDVIFLQETTPRWEEALREGFGERYPHMGFVHSGGAGGMAVLSRRPFSEGEVLEPPDGGWFPAWRVVIDSPLGEVQVLQVHLRPPLSETGSVVSGYLSTPPVRRASMVAFTEVLDLLSATRPGLPTLIVGDFNEAEDGQAIGFLAERGLRSALPEFDPGAETWRWDTSVGEVTSRLDHIVYDPKLAPIQARVVKAGRSDHLPVVAVFERTDL